MKKVKYSKLLSSLAPISSIVRLVAPWLVFSFPIPAIIINILLDATDAPLYRQRRLTRSQYQPIDKFLDMYWYGVCLVYAYHHLQYFPLLLGLLLFRLAGYGLFYVTSREKYFILFPNFYENIFVFLVFINAFPVHKYLLAKPNIYYVFAILAVAKFVQELIAHKYDKLYYRFAPEWVKAPE